MVTFFSAKAMSNVRCFSWVHLAMVASSSRVTVAHFRALQGYKSMPLTPPKQLTFLLSVVLAIAALVIRYLVYTGVQMPPFFPTGGFLLLLVAYLVLVVGNLVEGA